MIPPAQMTHETAILDCFLFRRRGFLSKDSGPKWDWDCSPEEKRLSGLNFELLRDADGTRALRVHYKVLQAQEPTNMDYVVKLDSRPIQTGDFSAPRRRSGESRAGRGVGFCTWSQKGRPPEVKSKVSSWDRGEGFLLR